MKNDTNQIGEAPASATLSVVTPKGYNTLFTLREMSGEMLLKKIGALETKLEELGYKPQIKQVFGQKKEIEYVQLNGSPMVCPMCKVGKVKVIHSAKGTFYGCDQSKFDPMTKTYTGCKYFSNTDPSKIVAKLEELGYKPQIKIVAPPAQTVQSAPEIDVDPIDEWQA